MTVVRRRVYAKSCTWGPSVVETRYLVARRADGAFGATPVATTCTSVKEALAWVWDGRFVDVIVARQGNVALVHAAGPKLPRHLPAACCVDKAAGVLRRPGHAPLRLPGPGERLIVARRARDRADAFTCTPEAL